MKKVFKSLLAIAFAAISFTSCEDVPAPYFLGLVNGGGASTSGSIYSENFDDGTSNFTYNVVSGPSTVWGIGSNNGRYWLNASAYQGGQDKASEAWAISPAINLSDSHEATLSFRHAINYLDATDKMQEWMTVWASTDKQNWTQLEVPTYPNGSSWTFVGSGDISLNDFCGQETVYIAFKYISVEGDAATWEVDEFTVSGDGTPMQPTEPQPVNPGEVSGTGTQEDPFNVAGVIAEAGKLASGTTGTEDVYTKGYIVEIKEYSDRYHSISYYIADDAEGTGNRFYVYSGKNFGGDDFTAATDLAVGDLVVICGKLTNFNGTLEYQYNNYLVERNGQTAGGETPTPQPTGSNLLTNGDFESWENGLPTNWKTTSTAGNATLSQSSDAHGGSYSVVVGMGGSSTKRMGYKETTLKAGTYTFKFYAKSTTTDVSQTQAGYCMVANGTVVANSYKYGGYVNLSNTSWTEVSTTFTLDQETTVCLVMMNPKTSNYATSQDILVDDAELLTSDGGLSDGSDNTPDPAPVGGLSFDFKANGQSGWNIVDTNLPDGLTYIWKYDTRYGMKASAYANSTNYASESWLISPALDLSSLTTATLKISHAGNYFGGAASDDCSVMVSTNYSSGNPSSASWTELNMSAWPTSFTFVDATASLTSVAGNSNVRIAFKYTSPASKAGTWEISSASIQ